MLHITFYHCSLQSLLYIELCCCYCIGIVLVLIGINVLSIELVKQHCFQRCHLYIPGDYLKIILQMHSPRWKYTPTIAAALEDVKERSSLSPCQLAISQASAHGICPSDSSQQFRTPPPWDMPMHFSYKNGLIFSW